MAEGEYVEIALYTYIIISIPGTIMNQHPNVHLLLALDPIAIRGFNRDVTNQHIGMSIGLTAQQLHLCRWPIELLRQRLSHLIEQQQSITSKSLSTNVTELFKPKKRNLKDRFIQNVNSWLDCLSASSLSQEHQHKAGKNQMKRVITDQQLLQQQHELLLAHGQYSLSLKFTEHAKLE